MLLCCGVVGMKCIIGVHINGEERVANLKQYIKEKQGYTFPASDLVLYVTKRGKWHVAPREVRGLHAVEARQPSRRNDLLDGLEAVESAVGD